MNKDEILAKAREENNGVDEVKRSVENTAAVISQAFGLCFCIFLSFLDNLYLKTGVIDSACWIIYGGIVTSKLWVHAVCLKNKWYYIGAVTTTIFVIVLLVFLITGVKNA